MSVRSSRSRPAWRAGSSAAITPHVAATATMTPSWAHGTMNRAVSTCCEMAKTSDQPRNIPSASPITAPKAPTSAASQRTMPRTCGRDIPTARSRPISRVRSTIDRLTVLAMPMSAISTASASIA